MGNVAEDVEGVDLNLTGLSIETAAAILSLLQGGDEDEPKAKKAKGKKESKKSKAKDDDDDDDDDDDSDDDDNDDEDDDDDDEDEDDEDEDEEPDEDDVKKMKVGELREFAKTLKLKKVDEMKKADLLPKVLKKMAKLAEG